MTRARDLMTTHLVTVEPSMTLEELESALLSAGVGGAPVVAEGRVVGIVSRSDIVRALAEERERAGDAVAEYYLEPPRGVASRRLLFKESDLLGQRMAELTVGDIMQTRIISAPPDATAVELAQLLVRYRIHRILVTEDDRLLGVVSTLDLVETLAQTSRAPSPSAATGDEQVSFTPDLEGERSALFPGDAEVATLRADPDGGASTLLVRLPPGGRIEAHRHPAPVQHYVLSGQYESDGRSFKVGTHRLVPNGHLAPITSSEGAVILMIYDPVPS